MYSEPLKHALSPREGPIESFFCSTDWKTTQRIVDTLNKTKDWALVQNAASASNKVELGLFR